MFSKIRKFISFGICLVVLGLALGSNAVPAQAATTITVGDDGARCHGSVSTIQAAVTALGANPTGKIIVCAGVYSTPTTISGANKLTIMGKPGAILRAPASFASVMINIQSSQKVTIQGLTFDGQGTLGVSGTTAGTTAIYVYNSSVIITKNTIVDWHTAGYGTVSIYAGAIRVIEPTEQTVTITRNTITGFQSVGIYVSGLAKNLNISSNTLSTTGTSVDKPGAIQVYNNPLGGKIAGNTITSDQFPSGTFDMSAIWVLESSRMTISGNKITHWFWGITLEGDGYTSTPASDNKIKGNKINEVSVGILIRSNAWGSVDAHADRNNVGGNKITNTTATGMAGIAVTGGNPAGGPNCYAQDLVIKGNTITNFTDGVLIDTGGGAVITGVFAPNTIR